MIGKQFVVGLAIAALLVGCAPSNPSTTTTTTTTNTGSSTTPLSGTVKVSIQGFAFSPATLTVKKGTKIEVTNQEIAGHTYTADDGSFDTPVIGKGQTQTVTMDKVGTFKVHCKPHPSITGTITVVE